MLDSVTIRTLWALIWYYTVVFYKKSAQFHSQWSGNYSSKSEGNETNYMIGNPTNNFILIKLLIQPKFFSFEIFINVLVSSSVLFEYLFYRSTAILNVLIISVRGPSLDARIWRLLTSDSDV